MIWPFSNGWAAVEDRIAKIVLAPEFEFVWGIAVIVCLIAVGLEHPSGIWRIGASVLVGAVVIATALAVVVRARFRNR
jgi:hypothetical protein